MELSVGELAIAGCASRVSRHVRILTDSGWSAARRGAGSIFSWLSRNAPKEYSLERRLDVEAEQLFTADAARLIRSATTAQKPPGAISRPMRRLGKAVFAADVADAEIERVIADLLADRPIGALLDIGTGTGRMLELFAPRADLRSDRLLVGDAAPRPG